ncbi:hypothetical protein GCM10022392_04090 [Mucilaginibacter panaciglaebae]|uniref:Uncharacterized protein n=1 Tax=Mucilaginibacter panaciglaebae TaxID=502331 RepID=A0ABP7WCZ0_9SPHI
MVAGFLIIWKFIGEDFLQAAVQIIRNNSRLRVEFFIQKYGMFIYYYCYSGKYLMLQLSKDTIYFE